MASLLRRPVLIACLGACLVAGLAACSSGAQESGAQESGAQAPGSEATASLSEPEAQSASTGFSDSDMSALRPETDESRETLWRLKGHTLQNQLRR